MQVKIIIGTIAFMLTMIIVGFISLREPARLEAFSLAFEGRSIENGAELFQNNCSTCHGINGKAEECRDASSGESIACRGRPLNNAELVCGDRSGRMEAMGWTGTKFDFVHSTIASGRPWAGMPTWGQQFGGPLQENQVRDVALFVLNWENEDMCAQVAEGGEEEAAQWPVSVSDLPAGDAERGQQLYMQQAAPMACTACHGDPAQEDSAAVGPWLGNIGEEGAGRQEGYTAADYVYESVLKPNAFIAPECPNGPCSEPSGMPEQFGTSLSPQDMADILAFLLGTSEFESSAEVQYPESDGGESAPAEGSDASDGAEGSEESGGSE